MALIGKHAPTFKAPAVTNGQTIVQDFSLKQFINQKEVLFFFYPKNFTFVCPTELVAFQEKLAAFESKGPGSALILQGGALQPERKFCIS